MKTDTKLTVSIIACFLVLGIAIIVKIQEPKPETPGAAPKTQHVDHPELQIEPDGVAVPRQTSDFMQAVSNEEGFRIPTDLKQHEKDYIESLLRLIPSNVSGFVRKGEQHGIAGSEKVRIPGAQAHFTNPQGATLTLAIVDVGALNRAAKQIGIYSKPEPMDVETELRIRRTFEHKGYTGTLDFDKETEGMRIEVMVEDQYLVSIDGEGISVAQGLGYLGLMPVEVLPRLKRMAID